MFFDEEDKALWKKLPGIIAKILETSNKWILSVPEWAVFNRINEWILSVSKGNIAALPTWVIYLAVVVIGIVAVPSIIILSAKMMIAVFTSKDGSRPLNGTLPECCKKTYKLAKRYYYLNREGAGEIISVFISSVIAGIILFLLSIWMMILEGVFSVDAIGDLVATIIGLIIVGALLVAALCCVAACLAFIPCVIKILGKMPVYKSDLRILENFWAEVDPEKKAELERQREDERKKRQEERKREEETRRDVRNSISSSSSGSCVEQNAYCDPDEYIARNGFSYICGVASDKDIDKINNDPLLTDEQKEAIKRALDSKASLYY